jgi:hypothetical protein
MINRAAIRISVRLMTVLKFIHNFVKLKPMLPAGKL